MSNQIRSEYLPPPPLVGTPCGVLPRVPHGARCREKLSSPPCARGGGYCEGGRGRRWPPGGGARSTGKRIFQKFGKESGARYLRVATIAPLPPSQYLPHPRAPRRSRARAVRACRRFLYDDVPRAAVTAHAVSNPRSVPPRVRSAATHHAGGQTSPTMAHYDYLDIRSHLKAHGQTTAANVLPWFAGNAPSASLLRRLQHFQPSAQIPREHFTTVVFRVVCQTVFDVGVWAILIA